MMAHSVLVEDVPDDQLGALLTHLATQGIPGRVLSSDAAPANGVPTGRYVDGALPARWRLVRELDDQAFHWPGPLIERYVRYRIYAADTELEGVVHVAMGEVVRGEAWGRDRTYRVLFASAAGPAKPIVEFLAVDDYEQTRQLIAVIRGSDGGKKMYGPGDSLPPAYGPLSEHVAIYRDRIDFRGSWTKLAIVAHEDDITTMLNHALLQARRRGDFRARPKP